MSGESSTFQEAKKKVSTLTPLVFFYNTFYFHLFELLPEVKPMFKRRISSQGKMLANIIKFIVSNIEDTSSVFTLTMEELAAVHNVTGVSAHYYSILGIVLIHAIRECCGPENYTELIRVAWIKVYSRMMEVMIPVVVKGWKLDSPEWLERKEELQDRIKKEGTMHKVVPNSPAIERRTVDDSKTPSSDTPASSDAEMRNFKRNSNQFMKEGFLADNNSTNTPSQAERFRRLVVSRDDDHSIASTEHKTSPAALNSAIDSCRRPAFTDDVISRPRNLHPLVRASTTHGSDHSPRSSRCPHTPQKSACEHASRPSLNTPMDAPEKSSSTGKCPFHAEWNVTVVGTPTYMQRPEDVARPGTILEMPTGRGSLDKAFCSLRTLHSDGSSDWGSTWPEQGQSQHGGSDKTISDLKVVPGA